jgi:hypothetical protein
MTVSVGRGRERGREGKRKRDRSGERERGREKERDGLTQAAPACWAGTACPRQSD